MEGGIKISPTQGNRQIHLPAAPALEKSQNPLRNQALAGSKAFHANYKALEI